MHIADQANLYRYCYIIIIIILIKPFTSSPSESIVMLSQVKPSYKNDRPLMPGPNLVVNCIQDIFFFVKQCEKAPLASKMYFKIEVLVLSYSVHLSLKFIVLHCFEN